MANLLRDNPVFLREVRWWLRLRWLRRNKSAAWTTSIIAFVFLWLYWRGLWAAAEGDQQALRPVWFLMVRCLLLVIVFLGPVLASTAIMKEREQRTWESLALTRLTARQIVLGKWLGSVTPFWAMILAAWPLLLVICAVLNTSFLGMLAVMAFLMVTAAAYTLLGVFCSFVARRTSVARALSLGIAAFFAFGLFILDAVIRVFLQFPGYRQYQPFSLGREMFASGAQDYGYFGAPSVTWFSPTYTLSVLSDWVSQPPSNGDDGYYASQAAELADIWSAHPQNVLYFYSVTLVIGCAFCLYYILTRYRRDVRGGRPLGETIT